MKKRMLRTAIMVLASALLLAVMLSGCAKKESAPEPVDLVLAATASPVASINPEPEPVASETAVKRQVGERFEDTIIIEGFEETVHYEHIRNDALGIEMDYDYESFVRHSEATRERFISVYDDPDHPEIYLEVTLRTEDADTVAQSIGEALSKDYDIFRDSVTLDYAGNSIRIDASCDKNGQTPYNMQAVYIIPAPAGCCVVTQHYTWDSADGFGLRFRRIINTIIIDNEAK